MSRTVLPEYSDDVYDAIASPGTTARGVRPIDVLTALVTTPGATSTRLLMYMTFASCCSSNVSLSSGLAHRMLGRPACCMACVTALLMARRMLPVVVGFVAGSTFTARAVLRIERRPVNAFASYRPSSFNAVPPESVEWPEKICFCIRLAIARRPPCSSSCSGLKPEPDCTVANCDLRLTPRRVARMATFVVWRT